MTVMAFLNKKLLDMLMVIFRVLFFLLIFLNNPLMAENHFRFSKIEEERLEHLFDYLFKFDSFSYTLFSDKPVSFEDLYVQNTSNTSLKNYITLLSYTRPINYLELGWKIWQTKSAGFNFKTIFSFLKANQIV